MCVPSLLRFLRPGWPTMHMRHGQAAFREAQRDFAQRDLDMYDSVWFRMATFDYCLPSWPSQMLHKPHLDHC